MTNLDVFPEQTEPSPGTMLKRRRQALNMTQEQVAKQLYMTVTKVNALENDDYGYLNSDTFIRGYIRAYANLLNLNIEILLKEYDALIEARTPAPIEEDVVVPAESSTKVSGFFIAIIAVFFLVVWLIDRWFFDGHNEQYVEQNRSTVVLNDQSTSSVVGDSPLAVNSLSQTASALERTKSNEQATSAATTERSSISTASTGIVASSAGQAVVAADSEKAEAKAVQAATPSAATPSTESAVEKRTKSVSLDEISFQFTAECWLEVSDSRGDVLATELQPAGSQLKLVGRAPFDVKVGNAPAVGINFNGKKVDVIPLLGTNVLTLKVGP